MLFRQTRTLIYPAVGIVRDLVLSLSHQATRTSVGVVGTPQEPPRNTRKARNQAALSDFLHLR